MEIAGTSEKKAGLSAGAGKRFCTSGSQRDGEFIYEPQLRLLPLDCQWTFQPMRGNPVSGIAPAFYRRPPGSAFFNRSEKTVVLPGAKYWTERLQDDAESRAEYFSRMLDAFGNVDLIFFDPDNGLEVKSRKYGHQHSSKYLDWRELIECCFGAGLSTLPS